MRDDGDTAECLDRLNAVPLIGAAPQYHHQFRSALSCRLTLGCPASRIDLSFAVAVGEACITWSGPDRQNSPSFHVLHEGRLRQALHNAVIVHDDRGIVLSDLRNGLDQVCRED
jgi:hypothetical protein